MQEKSGTILSFIKGLTLLLLALAAVGYTYQYGRSVNQYSDGSFTVFGEGKVMAIPDTAKFSARIITEGSGTVAQIQQQNSEKMNAVIAFVKEQGIDSKDIQTQQYALQPRYEYTSCTLGKTCPPAKIAGYTLSQSIDIKVRNTNEIGNLLSGVVEKGANSVSDIAFVVDDAEKAKNEAREKAMQQAKKQAASMARAGGFQLGKIISVYEENPQDGYAHTVDMQGGAYKQMEQASAPSIELGSNEYTSKMVLVYEIR